MTGTEKDITQSERDALAELLPWYAAGTLSAAETLRVERALGEDAELARQLDLVREELDETVLSNQRLSGASPRALDQLFARIDAEPQRGKARKSLLDLGGRLADWLSPKTLAWAGVAAALIIAVQAGALLDLAGRGGGTTYETASAPEARAQSGTLLMVGFQPGAQAGAIEALLAESDATIVEGPKAGLYKLRIGPADMPKAEAERVLALLKSRPALVRFAAPSR